MVADIATGRPAAAIGPAGSLAPMARGRTETLLVTRWSADGARREPDDLIVEEPLSIRLDDHLVATTMRTPGHDYELAAGFCFTEGLLGGAPVEHVRYCATGGALETAYNVVTVGTGGLAPVPASRLTVTTSSCGLCGAEALDALAARLAPLGPEGRYDYSPEELARLVDRTGGEGVAQPLFDATGAAHAAVAFDEGGRALVVREDVGRHNAVDKVIGRLLFDGCLPARDLALVVTSRASFEIVQKAWAAGFSAVVSVSGATALAVSTARRAGLTLAGFARPGRLNIYAPERVDR